MEKEKTSLPKIALPEVSINQLFDVKAHFGHRKWYLNSKMIQYIHSERNGLSIIDLKQTLPLLNKALRKLYEVGNKQGKILFVGTKKHISDIVKSSAERCAQFYVNYRWLGGLLTNWTTINKSILKLRDLEKDFEEKIKGYTKKEISLMESKKQKMKDIFDGIKEMNGLPDLIVILDMVGSGRIAVKEAKQKNIPVIALIDTNCDPSLVDYPIPSNDDSAQCVSFMLDLFVKSILFGVRDSVSVEEMKEELKEENSKIITDENSSDIEDSVSEAGDDSSVENEVA